MDVELEILNGTVVDPDADATYEADLGVSGGKIVAISRQRGQISGRETVDARGLLVTPGLVDSHVHVYQHVSSGSLDPDDIGIRQGVCAVVDAGSFGPGNAAGFREYVVKRATTHVYGLVNISRNGNSTQPGEGEVLGFLRPEATAATVARNREWAVGVRVRASNTASGVLGITSTRLA
jgi:dihydroorotase